MIQNTAILIFANSAEKDAERKSFLSADAIAALNKDTLKKVKKSGITYFHFSEKNQVGANFGERFSNAIASVFKKGYQNVITIGNDTPHLKTNHILKAAHQLEHSNLVLGPSKDGGFYLMGIKKAHFNKKAFVKLPWQTNLLNAYISKLSASSNSSIAYLELLNDLDAQEDIATILESRFYINKEVLLILKKLFIFNKATFYHLEKSIESFLQPLYYNKGSPSLAA